MKFICPLITVADIKRSREFYEGLLNLKVKFDFGENVTFEGDFAIHLQSHYSKLIDNRPIQTGGNNFELYFEFDQVDQIANFLSQKDVEFVHDVREQPWRQKVVRCYDPDRYIIEIGESMEYLSFRLSSEGLTTEQISNVTGLPVDFVNVSINNLKK